MKITSHIDKLFTIAGVVILIYLLSKLLIFNLDFRSFDYLLLATLSSIPIAKDYFIKKGSES